MSFITTYTGLHMDPTQARPADLRITDIAHALSLLCRGNGQLRHFYSVAQHCVACALEAAARGHSPAVQLGCLLHDASEAYLSDITRPVKVHLPHYRRIEAALQTQLYLRFLGRLPDEAESAQIAAIDDAMLYHEFLQLMHEAVFPEAPALCAPLDLSFRPFAEVEAGYLSLFDQLSEGNAAQS